MLFPATWDSLSLLPVADSLERKFEERLATMLANTGEN